MTEDFEKMIGAAEENTKYAMPQIDPTKYPSLACDKCGNVFYKKTNNQIYCSECQGYEKIGVKTLVCCDCGKEFEVNSKNNNANRCSECYSKYRKEYYRINKQNKRKSL